MTTDTKRKLSIQNLSVKSGLLKESKSEITVKPISVESLKLDQINITQTESETVTFKNGDIQLRLELKAVLDLPGPGDIEFPVKHKTIPFDLRSIELDTSGASIDVTSSETNNIIAPAPDLPPIKLQDLTMEEIAAENTELPSDGFELNGLQLGNLKLDTLSLPQSTIEKLSIKRIRPKNDTVEIASVETGPLPLPETVITSINATIPKATMSASFSITFDKSLAHELRLECKAIVIITNLNIELENLKVTGSIQKISINNISIPLSLENTILNGLVSNSIVGQSINL